METASDLTISWTRIKGMGEGDSLSSATLEDGRTLSLWRFRSRPQGTRGNRHYVYSFRLSVWKDGERLSSHEIPGQTYTTARMNVRRLINS